MKLQGVIRVLAPVLMVCAWALAQPRTAADRFKALMQSELDAWSTLDPAKAAPFFAKDADRVFFDIAPLKYTGWNEYEAGTRKFFADFKSLKLTMGPDARAAQAGNTAWGTATIHVELVNKNDTKEAFDARWTVVWEKRGKDWLVVHEHVSAPAPEAPDLSTASLYKRLGGYDAIAAVTDDFIGRLARDAKLGRFFGGHATGSLSRIRQLVVDQLCNATGGPCVYTGRDMKSAHAGMGITNEDWRAAVGHLNATLDKFKVPAKERAEVISAIGGMQRDIVTGQ
jgi:hemoglobin